MGFFTTSEIKNKYSVELNTETMTPLCKKCGLLHTCKTPRMKYGGEGRKKILIIAEAPGYNEDIMGTPFVGEAGDFLKRKLAKFGIVMNRDCWKANVVSCHPPQNKTPTQKQIDCCRPNIEKIIYTLKPKVIFLFGKVAITSLFGKDFSNRKINRWRAYCIPDERYKCHIIPMFHPSYLIRNEKDENLHTLFERDLKFAVSCINRKYEKPSFYEDRISILTSFDEVSSYLKNILRTKPKIAFDYETTGLKPFRQGHAIGTIGIAISEEEAVAFPFDYKNFWNRREFKRIKSLWKAILADPDIKKICHNMKFEDNWSAIKIGTQIRNGHWDTMIAEHILDNRQGGCGLKFLTFVHFGVRPYDKHIKPYLEASNGEYNKLFKAPFKDLLTYNGLDCIFTYKLYNRQKPKIDGMKGLKNAFQFFMRGVQTMSYIQLNGIHTDIEYYTEKQKEIKKEIVQIKKRLEKGREGKKFKQKYNRTINLTSNDDLGKLFYEILGKEPIYTDNENYKTDKSTIESLNLPFVDKLLRMKKLEKLQGTYIAQFKREVVGNRMYPFFNLHIPVTYRSSSSNPNFQNLPKRDEESKAIIRRGMRPSPGCILIEADFSGAEVCTSLFYHKDSNFYIYLTDPNSDMHRDMAQDIWMLPPDMLINKSYNKEQKKKAKMVRFYAKNNWTFAQFYGDWFGSCGPILWENCVESGLELPNGQTIKEWLEEQGVYELGEMTSDGPTPGSFLEHLAEVEYKMWNERFPEYAQWKKDIVDFYRKYGYIETYLGFRFVGYMTPNQCCNYPIQSTSFHLLVDTLISFRKFLLRKKLGAKIIGQIHDSIVIDCPVEEKDIVIKTLAKIIRGLKDKYNWMIIPMDVEVEVSKSYEEGGNFAEMTEIPLEV